MRAAGSWRCFLPAALLLAACAALLQARSVKEYVAPHKALASFPKVIEGWRGRDLGMDQATLDVLGPGDFLMRNYFRSAPEPAVNLYIAYFPSQRMGDTIHSPQNCLPGAGWTPVESKYISFPRGDGTTISINRYIVSKGLDRDLVFYWYQAHGRVTPSEYRAKFYLVADAIDMNRTDGALVRIVTPVGNAEDEAAAETRASKFTQRVLPLLDSYIPR
jgi:EpsI family protein